MRGGRSLLAGRLYAQSIRGSPLYWFLIFSSPIECPLELGQTHLGGHTPWRSTLAIGDTRSARSALEKELMVGVGHSSREGKNGSFLPTQGDGNYVGDNIVLLYFTGRPLDWPHGEWSQPPGIDWLSRVRCTVNKTDWGNRLQVTTITVGPLYVTLRLPTGSHDSGDMDIPQPRGPGEGRSSAGVSEPGARVSIAHQPQI